MAKFTYGKSQVLTSDKMKKYPKLSKLTYSVFGYTNVGNYARSKVFIKLLNKLDLSKVKTILDLGCGLGEFSFMISDAMPNAKITSLDVDKDRLEKVKGTKDQLNYDNIELFHGMVHEFPKDEYFDLIFSVDVFEHILKENMPFEDAYKKLKPGGHLIVKMPNITQLTIFPDSWFKEHQDWLDDEHIGQVYNLDDLRNRFIKAGFEIEEAHYSDGYWSRLAWETGYFAKRGGMFTQLLFLPLSKFFVSIDQMGSNGKKGNAIQVIGRKPA